MADPVKLFETALFSYLDGALAYTVYNTEAAGTTFNYVVFEPAGGDDTGYHMKKRIYVYARQIVGIHTDRSTALDMAVAIDTAMEAAAGSLSIAGHDVVRVSRTGPVDYSEVLDDGVYVHHIGGTYEIELQEA